MQGLTCFQALLVAGAPLGRYAWGGQHDVLPRTLRIASAVSIAIYVVIAIVILARGTVIGHVFGEPVTRIGIWVLTGYFALGVLLNLASRSSKERIAMTPVALALMLCCLLLAL